MNSKIKFLTTLVLISGVILLMGIGCVKKAATPAPEGAPAGGAPAVEQPAVEQPTPAPAKEGDIGKMTEEIYVEIYTQNAYHVEKGAADWLAGDGFGKLLKKYDVTSENFEAYGKKLSEDPQLTQDFFQKYQKRYNELKAEK